MPIASLASNSIAKEKITDGVIYGCRLMEKGRQATFSNAGKPTTIDCSPELITRLAELAIGKSIPAHWSHDYLTDDRDPIHARVGAWKDVRVCALTGNLVGDLHLMPSQYKEAILWLAENTPDGAMTSAVFPYNDLGGNKAYALEFRAADIVSRGAATTALFSKTQTDTDMTKEEIQALVTESVTAALKAYKPEGYITKAEADASVTAALAGYKVSDDDKKEIAILAQAETVKSLGATTLIAKIGETQKSVDSFDAAIVAQLAAGAKNRGDAILRVARVQPELYNAALVAGKI